MENIDYKSLHLTPEQEDQNIEAAFQDVLDGYLHSNHRKKVEIIKRAYSFAKEAHKGIRRRSGEPYILHPIAVAKIVSQEIGLGCRGYRDELRQKDCSDCRRADKDFRRYFRRQGFGSGGEFQKTAADNGGGHTRDSYQNG